MKYAFLLTVAELLDLNSRRLEHCIVQRYGKNLPLGGSVLVALMTFGNYVLFNLLVAILVEGFSAEDERKRSDESINREEEHKQVKKHLEKNHNHLGTVRSSPPPPSEILSRPRGGSHFPLPLITHTAATPQGSPNNTLEPLMRDLKDRLTPLMAFNVPGQSFESIDKTSTIASLPDSGSQSSRSQRTSIGSEILMYVPNYEVPNSPVPSRETDCLNVNMPIMVICLLQVL
ncbi:voltage-dependent T-type calcium channel subunit alpha [Caerostris extrusa]|uniref:Voltage-dependent T-type calcium channel subunit alpha n=1 Tax=Caerostris extrusa TaxID=172846 RepID=A0AAV4RHS9_CAEEX|nr:voltage-dependent T-type calcium channel subunit alpha [Caerostris extrusa]